MKKYRCPKCKTVFAGTPEVCPNCGAKLRYANKQEQKPVEEATTIENFSFNDPEVVKHEDKVLPVTSVESFEDPEAIKNPQQQQVSTQFKITGDSFFDGRMIQRVGITLLSILIFLVSAGIAYPWAMCLKMRWETKHTIIQGHRLKFTGKGIQLFGRYLLWLLLTIFTVGIILLWVQIFLKQWKIKHTEFAD